MSRVWWSNTGGLLFPRKDRSDEGEGRRGRRSEKGAEPGRSQVVDLVERKRDRCKNLRPSLVQDGAGLSGGTEGVGGLREKGTKTVRNWCLRV